MKIPFLIFLLVIFQGCILHYDRLEYYNEGYKPNNTFLPTKGYYYKSQPDTINSDIWPEAIYEMYFFGNGTFILGGKNQSMNILDKSICECKTIFNYGPHGFYSIVNDTILVEYIVTDPMGDHKAIRSYFKAVQIDSAINIFEWNNQKRYETWKFHPNKCVPDTLHNWLENHRKYKLKGMLTPNKQKRKNDYTC